MREMQRIKRIIIPLLKGLPILIITLLIALFIAKKAIQYSVPKYQSMAKIKLDDRKYGMSGNNLYEDFDVFSSENKIETEAEILKSPLLIGKTIDKMDLSVLMFRMGVIKNTFLYQDNPFEFLINTNGTSLYDQSYVLTVTGNYFTIENLEEEKLATGEFGTPFQLEYDTLIIQKNETLLSQKKLDIDGKYQFEIKSQEQWIQFLNQQLDVKAIDKEIPVLRVVMKSENPEFSADFANALCTVYIEDYIYTKSMAATKTLSFIDERMNALKTVLSASENSLESYKKEHDVVNTLQETETGLRELSKLKLQLINLEMEEKAVIALEEYIAEGDYYEETAINFGFGDLLLTELVKKLKLFTDEKRDLLLKYTTNDPKVVNAQNKIDDIEAYVKEAILQNKNTIQTKREEIQLNIKAMDDQFENIPTREKEMRILERDFQINESVYTFLAQKKLEAQIASSALMSFHRVIQPATPAKEPVSPNKVLITFVCGFLGLFAGILIVFGGRFVQGKVLSKADIEKLTATPVIGVLTKANTVQLNEFITLATALRNNCKIEKRTILITSSTKQEGKSYVASNLADAYAKMGFSTAVLDFNAFNPLYIGQHDYNLETWLNDQTELNKLAGTAGEVTRIGLTENIENATLVFGHKKMTEVMLKLKASYDFIIIDTPGSVISIDALCMLKYADEALYIIRAKSSKAQYIPNVDAIQADCDFSKMSIVLNGAHVSTNYSGNFNGSQLHYHKKPAGILNRIMNLISTYSK